MKRLASDCLQREPPRIVVFSLMHETHSFSKMPADRKAFENGLLGGFWAGAEVLQQLRGKNTEIAGFIDVAEEEGWTLIPTVAGFANPCGPVTRDVFEYARSKLIAGLGGAEAGGQRPAGVLLALHGAMVVEDIEDGECEIVRTVRQVLGADVPVLCTLDLHANVSDEMFRLTDAVISYQTYPHVDFRARAVDAARLLSRMLSGELRVGLVWSRKPMMAGVDMGRTDAGPNVEYQRMARAAEVGGENPIPGILNVSINAGFPFSDVSCLGPTTSVTYDRNIAGAAEAAQALADDIMKRQWEDRHIVTNRILSCTEAVREACEHLALNNSSNLKGPVVIADFTDNPGAGTYGDATNLLKELLEAGIENAAFAAIRDAEAAALLVEKGVGQQVTDVLVGGKEDATFGGEPLALSGTIVNISPTGRFKYWGPMFTGLESYLGPAAVLRATGTRGRGSVDVVIVSNLVQVLDIGMLVEGVGLDPRRKSIVCVKSHQHFRGAYGPIASQILIADSGALASMAFRKTKFPFKRVPRPIYPLQHDFEDDQA